MSFLSLLRTSALPVGKLFSESSGKICVVKSLRPFLFQKGSNQLSSLGRRYSANQNFSNSDPNQQKRRKGLLVLTYVSGFIGACMLTAVGAREYQRLKMRARGIEPVKNRLYGRKTVLYRYRGYVLPDFAMDVMHQVHPFKVREDDIFIMSYPKSGTTWMQEIVYLINNDVDFESVKSNVEDRIPYFEYMYPGIPEIDKMSSPRYFKTHLPFSLLPNDYKEKKPKTIYVARNVKDVVVSLHYMLQKFLTPIVDYRISLDDFCQLLVNNEVMYGPWWKHVKEGWERRNDDNVLFMTYEDMQKDLPGSIRKVAAHLGKTLSPQDVEAIADHCSFNKMQDNKFVNFSWFQERGHADKKEVFMRKGKVGDWKNHLSKDAVANLDDIMEKQVAPTGLRFTDSLDGDEV